jgi:hypothetical protein
MKVLLFTVLSLLIVNKACSQQHINTDEAGKHIGEICYVKGTIYDGRIRQRKGSPGLFDEVLYMGNSRHPAKDFILIIKMTPDFKGNTFRIDGQDKYFDKKSTSELVPHGEYQAKGKIILFEGKPSITINESDLIITEKVG